MRILHNQYSAKVTINQVGRRQSGDCGPQSKLEVTVGGTKNKLQWGVPN